MRRSRFWLILAVLGLAALFGTPTVGAGAPLRTSGSVPAGFLAQSVNWPSASAGRILGSVGCGDRRCTVVAGTENAGRSWSVRGTVPAPLAQPGEPGVTRLRFADAGHGWAFGPALYRTAAGGRTWRSSRMPGGGRQVVALATEADVTYLAVSPCRIGEPPYECAAPTTLWRSDPGRSRWRRVPVRLPVTAGAQDVMLALRGATAYVAVAGEPGRPGVFYASPGGRQWSARRAPCDTSTAETMAGITALPHDRLMLLCLGDVGLSRSTKRVFASPDAGRTARYLGTAPRPGIACTMAATPSGRLVIGSASTGNWLYSSADGRAWRTALAEPGGGWNDLQFTTDRTGFVVDHPGAGDSAGNAVLTTHDGGAHWTRLHLGP
ncbi:hypothetical protein [Sciscionella sediminilitoris]|uniref:hypothetical protein n=1 Tax=Sciscionella sediminilitoris TaxID=1445613 RepID=UPI0004DF661E|nr:hypothetical protein [Sciscionella sp. SE31]